MGCAEALLIFARYPRKGQVKTRLRPRLSDSKILALYRAFLEDTLGLAATISARCFLFLADCSASEASTLAAGLTQSRVQVCIQKGNDLGERMWNAYRSVAQDHLRVVYLGADTPSLPSRLVEESFHKLKRYPVVIGPSTDGGYYLLGLSSPRRQLFEGIPWGTHQVLERSLERLPREDLHLLPRRSDVDTPEDLDRLGAELALHPERAPRTAKRLKAL